MEDFLKGEEGHHSTVYIRISLISYMKLIEHEDSERKVYHIACGGFWYEVILKGSEYDLIGDMENNELIDYIYSINLIKKERVEIFHETEKAKAKREQKKEERLKELQKEMDDLKG